MAINAATNWYVRVAGNVLNGGGWDPTIASAGTNYADADAAILSLTDFATSGVTTTVTTATGGMTAAMIGNCWRLASGTNATAGYYFITAVTDTNTFTVDRAPCSAAMTGGTGRIGGAFATPWGSLSSSGAGSGYSAPTITTPLQPGNMVWIRGSGTDDPSTPDYDMGNSLAQYPSGTQPLGAATGGRITWRGYNGRPLLRGDIIFHSLTLHVFADMGFIRNAVSTYPEYGMLNGTINVIGCRFDSNGLDTVGIATSGSVYGTELRNPSGGAAGVKPAIKGGTGFVPANIIRCKITGWRGAGIYFGRKVSYGGDAQGVVTIFNTIVSGCGVEGILIWPYATYNQNITTCTIYDNGGHGIYFHAGDTVVSHPDYPNEVPYGVAGVFNNVIMNNGGYGIKLDGDLAHNNRNVNSMIDYNAFMNNTSGNYDGITANTYNRIGENDITLSADPFTSAATGDFSLNNTAGGGALLRGAAFPQW